MIAIRPAEDQTDSPGLRIRVEQDEPDDLVRIVHEVTLPERVHRIDASRVKQLAMLTLTVPDALWLHAVLGEILHAGEEPDLVEVPSARLVAMHRDLGDLISHELNPVVHGALVIRRSLIERAIAIHNAHASARDGIG